MNRTMVAVAALGAAMLAPMAASAAELVSNGGFETGDFSDWTLFGVPMQLGLYVDVDTIAPNSGTYAAYFGTEDPSGIFQTLSTVAGQSYTISFALQVEDNLGDVTPNSFAVTFGGQTIYAFTDAPASNYALFSFTAQATSALTELRFTTTDLTSFIDLDDVSVTEAAATSVPEPASWALMILGLGAAGGMIRGQRRRLLVA